MRDLLAVDGTSLTTYKALKELLGLEAGSKSSPLKPAAGKKRRRSPSPTSDDESDAERSDVGGRRKRSRTRD